MSNDTRKKGDTWMLHRLLADLGVDNPDDEEAVDNKIKEMEKRFHLVMILEHFEVTTIFCFSTIKYICTWWGQIMILCWTGSGPCDFSVIHSPKWTFDFWTAFGWGMGMRLGGQYLGLGLGLG